MARSRVRFVSIAAVTILLATVGVLAAYADRLESARGANDAGAIPATLPPIERGPQTVTKNIPEALVTLSFDDGTCEAGLGVGAPHTALVDFDVPAQCTTGGFSIVQLTTRVNTGTATAFTLRQAGATPGGVGSGTNVGMSNVAAAGACPATGFVTRTIAPAPVVAGGPNFFAGVNYGVSGGFIGRDTNSPNAMRQWLNCPTCGMSTYSPADITGIGFPGNFLIRVTGEDMNCVPVELMEFTVDSR